MKDFFISYNKKDQSWAEWIAWHLEVEGYETVIQAWDFRPGSNFVLEMHKAASESKRTIAVLSPNYLNALYTKPEWTAAIVQDPTGVRGKMLLVRVRECDLEGILATITYVDLVGFDEEKARDALLAGVKQERAKPEAPPLFPGHPSRKAVDKPRFPGALPTKEVTSAGFSLDLRITLFLFGVFFVTALLIIAFICPRPTLFQYIVFRTVLALAAAGIAACILGFIALRLLSSMKSVLQVGGAMAVSVIIFFFSPADLVIKRIFEPPEEFLRFAIKLSFAERSLYEFVETLKNGEAPPEGRNNTLREITNYYKELLTKMEYLKTKDSRIKYLQLKVHQDHEKVKQIYDETKINIVNVLPDMVSIPSGQFQMGSSEIEIERLIIQHSDWKSEWLSDEKPQRKVFIDSFYISKYEITNSQYQNFLEDNPTYKDPIYWNDKNFNAPNQPVVGVSWYDAVAYCNWLSNKNRKTYRLPTEAEWERAAKGNDNRIFPWGNSEPNINKTNFMQQNKATTPVGGKTAGASSYGIMDMAGNVWEWCSDWYDENYYQFGSKKNPAGPESGNKKVLRGGSWQDEGIFLRLAKRYKFPPDIKRENIGFRVVQQQ